MQASIQDRKKIRYIWSLCNLLCWATYIVARIGKDI